MATRVQSLKQMGVQIAALNDQTILRAKEAIDIVQQRRDCAQTGQHCPMHFRPRCSSGSRPNQSPIFESPDGTIASPVVCRRRHASFAIRRPCRANGPLFRHLGPGLAAPHASSSQPSSHQLSIAARLLETSIHDDCDTPYDTIDRRGSPLLHPYNSGALPRSWWIQWTNLEAIKYSADKVDGSARTPRSMRWSRPL